MTSLLEGTTPGIDRQRELVDGRDVVLGRRILVESESIFGADAADFSPAEFAVGPGVVDVPGVLLADHATTVA